jgi:hypothetical protein
MTLRLLSAYLFQFHRLPLPELGTLILNKQAAQFNILNRNIQPCFFSVELNSNEGDVSHLVQWLAIHLNSSAEETVKILYEYVYKIKDHLNNSDQLIWGNLGVLKKTGPADYTFKGNTLTPLGYISIQAKKVARKPKNKVLTVGRSENDDALVQLLKNSKRKKLSSRVYLSAITLGICLLMVSSMLLMNKGIREKHQQQFKINSKAAPDTYTII